MLLNRYRRLRIASLLILLVLLPVTGYVWAQPLTPQLVAMASVLSVLCLLAVIAAETTAAVVEREASRLSDECREKALEISNLHEFTREDELIVDRLTEQNSELRGKLIASVMHETAA